MLASIFSAVELINPGDAGLPQTVADKGTLDTIFTFVYITIGAVALFFIVVAGLRYVMSQGDPAKTAQAKNVILYTLIGLIIAALATTIVSYALKA